MNQDKKIAVKVCGLHNTDEMIALAKMGVQYLGFNFWPSSPRYALPILDAGALQLIQTNYPKVHRTGIFVDAALKLIKDTAKMYLLDTIQLHGHEEPEMCAALSQEYTVIKAFTIDSTAAFEKCAAYAGSCSLFLFDAPGAFPGGNGQSFSWDFLQAYKEDIPFLLAGGIGLKDTVAIRHIQHPQFYGVDLNSRFEDSPGYKNCTLIQQFIHELDTPDYELRSK
jgi:phosphoribosylanthranilate isomerase